MKRLFLVLLALLTCSCGITFLGKKSIYESPLAYKRSTESSVTLKRSPYLGSKVNYIEAALGRTVPIATREDVFPLMPLHMQFAIEASAWMTLGYDKGAFPLLTQDYLMAGGLFFEYKDFTGAIKANHISAHLGDGMEKILEDNLSEEKRKEFELYESIGESVGVDVNLLKPFAYSRDFASGHLAYHYKMGPFLSTSYLQAGYAWKMIPRELGRYFAGGGVEGVYYDLFIPPENFYATPYYAVDVTYNADTKTMDVSGQAGIIFLSFLENGVTMRIALTGYHGSDRRGQLLGRKLRQVGIGVFLR